MKTLVMTKYKTARTRALVPLFALAVHDHEEHTTVLYAVPMPLDVAGEPLAKHAYMRARIEGLAPYHTFYADTAQRAITHYKGKWPEQVVVIE